MIRKVFCGTGVFVVFLAVLALIGCTSEDENGNRLTFSIPVNITGTGDCDSADIVVDNFGHINVVFCKMVLERSDIYSVRSTDEGVSWSPLRNVYHSPSIKEFDPVVETDGAGHISVVWRNTLYDVWDVYYCRSIDGGVTWRSPVNISGNIGFSEYPDISLNSGGVIYVVWEDRTLGNREIYFSRSTSSGSTWSPFLNLSDGPGESSYSRIKADNSGNLHVVWEEEPVAADTLSDILYRRSGDGGVTWTPAAKISLHPEINDWWPSMDVDGAGNVYVVWQHGVGGNIRVYFSCSMDGGATWSQPVEVSNTLNAWWPEIDVDDSGHVNVVWSEGPAPSDHVIKFRRSSDNGSTWGEIITVSAGSGDARGPAIASNSSGKVFLVWFRINSGVRDIYFSCSQD